MRTWLVSSPKALASAIWYIGAPWVGVHMCSLSGLVKSASATCSSASVLCWTGERNSSVITRSLAANAASGSPKSFSWVSATLPGAHSCSWGAPGCMALRSEVTAGSNSYSTSIRSSAASAISGSVAATAATSSPT